MEGLKNNKIDKILVFLLLVFLVIYHTFTYAQLFYNFFVTCFLGGVVFFILFFNDPYRSTRLRINISSVIVVFSVIAICLLAIMIKGESSASFFGKYVPYFLWPLLFMYIRKYFCCEEKKILLDIFFVFYLIGNISTICMLLDDPEAARLLAGVAESNLRKYYYSRGVGGYGYIYGSVLLLYVVLSLIRKESVKFFKIIYTAVAVSGYIMIFFAGYTTALFLTVISLSLWIAYVSKNKCPAIIIGILSVLLFIFKLEVIDFFIQVFYEYDFVWFSKRLSQLYYALSGNDYESLSRTILYEKSINCFFSNPIIGEGKVGGHSELLDILGQYGLVGAVFMMMIISIFYRIIKNYPIKYNVIFSVLLLFIFVDPLDQMVMLPMCTFVTPLLIDYLCELEKITLKIKG